MTSRALLAVALVVAAPPDAAERARRIHASLIGVDSHIDTVQRVLNGKEDISQRLARGHVDLPRLKQAGMVAPFFALWVPAYYKGAEAVRRTLAHYDLRAFAPRVTATTLLMVGAPGTMLDGTALKPLVTALPGQVVVDRKSVV